MLWIIAAFVVGWLLWTFARRRRGGAAISVVQRPRENFQRFEERAQAVLRRAGADESALADLVSTMNAAMEARTADAVLETLQNTNLLLHTSDPRIVTSSTTRIVTAPTTRIVTPREPAPEPRRHSSSHRGTVHGGGTAPLPPLPVLAPLRALSAREPLAARKPLKPHSPLQHR
ncbi:MAG: hypothetical protein JO103_15405 [Candidatus Eremiobacteraeota bacterium]|nr:hypothetical protein [Candidatus Eremiobacteraeota bacterium]MBV9408505.1 hypothetical protein [Candidatus Eremiobacteraeota bacterium]